MLLLLLLCPPSRITPPVPPPPPRPPLLSKSILSFKSIVALIRSTASSLSCFETPKTSSRSKPSSASACVPDKAINIEARVRIEKRTSVDRFEREVILFRKGGREEGREGGRVQSRCTDQLVGHAEGARLLLDLTQGPAFCPGDEPQIFHRNLKRGDIIAAGRVDVLGLFGPTLVEQPPHVVLAPPSVCTRAAHKRHLADVLQQTPR